MIDAGCVAKTAVREKDFIIIADLIKEVVSVSGDAVNMVYARLNNYTEQADEAKGDPISSIRSVSPYFREAEVDLRNILGSLYGIREAFERAEI